MNSNNNYSLGLLSVCPVPGTSQGASTIIINPLNLHCPVKIVIIYCYHPILQMRRSGHRTVNNSFKIKQELVAYSQS